MRQLMFLSTLGALSLLLSGCNTMEGLGKDIKKGGQNLEHSAERNKSPNTEPPKETVVEVRKEPQTY